MSRQYSVKDTFSIAQQAAKEIQVFYNFTETRQLYILPMPATREWFLLRLMQFPERETTTPIAGDHYTTVGRLVSIKVVCQEVKGVWQVTIPKAVVF